MVLQREKVGNGMNMSMDMRRDIQRLSVTIRDCCTHKRGILGYTVYTVPGFTVVTGIGIMS